MPTIFFKLLLPPGKLVDLFLAFLWKKAIIWDNFFFLKNKLGSEIFLDERSIVFKGLAKCICQAKVSKCFHYISPGSKWNILQSIPTFRFILPAKDQQLSKI